MVQRLSKKITEAYTILITDNGTTLICDSAIDFTITLPSAIGFPNFDVRIDNIGVGIVTCIDKIISQNSHAHVTSNNIEWFISLGKGILNVLIDDLFLYLSPTGNDSNSGTSEEDALLTLGAVSLRLDAIDISINLSTVIVSILDMTFSEGFNIIGWVNARINIIGDYNQTSNTIVDYLEFSEFEYCYIRGLITTYKDAGFSISNIKTVEIESCVSDISIDSCQNAYINNCDVTTPSSGIISKNGSYVLSQDNIGTCDNYGLYSATGNIQKIGIQPTGLVKNDYGFVYLIIGDNGDLILPPLTPLIITEEYTVNVDDPPIICNSSTPFTVTLHASTGIGIKHTISNVNTGAVTIDANASETINGELTQTIYQTESIDIYDYATGKWVVQ